MWYGYGRKSLKTGNLLAFQNFLAGRFHALEAILSIVFDANIVFIDEQECIQEVSFGGWNSCFSPIPMVCCSRIMSFLNNEVVDGQMCTPTRRGIFLEGLFCYLVLRGK